VREVSYSSGNEGILLCEKMSKRSEEMDADAHVSDDNVTVGVLGAVENVLGSEEWVKREG